MGVDFIRERAHDFTRCWDRHRIELAERSLFTEDPECLPRAAIAKTSRPVQAGTVLIVRCESGGLVGYDELTPVAWFVEPPADMVSSIRECGGCAKGEVAAIYDTNLVEITTC